VTFTTVKGSKTEKTLDYNKPGSDGRTNRNIVRERSRYITSVDFAIRNAKSADKIVFGLGKLSDPVVLRILGRIPGRHDGLIREC
jgi:hypothetical protein